MPLFPYPMSTFKSVSPIPFHRDEFSFSSPPFICSFSPKCRPRQGRQASNGFASQQNLPCHDSCTPPCTCEFLTCASRHTRPSLLPSTPNPNPVFWEVEVESICTDLLGSSAAVSTPKPARHTCPRQCPLHIHVGLGW